MAVPSQPLSNPPKAPHIRAASAADAVAISQLGAHVFSVTFGHSVPPHELQAFLDKDYSTAAITADLENPSKDTIVATDDDGNDIIAFAILTRGTSEPCLDDVPNKVELQRIYVHPHAHGKGLGGTLAQALEEMAREQGFANIWLGVWEENHAAQKAYEKWGYRRVGSHDFVIGSVVQTDYIMLKSL
ncbi:acyl-CoA N-acyltransferase [Peniophora sp. CONT]|nr:acyl-CoA N-acyltransferase [Peniophora sp. CONT]